MIYKGNIYVFVFFLLAISLSVNAQTYKFKQYSVEQGLSQPFVYTINQDNKGYLWAGTGEGLCRFDGINFTTFINNDSLSDNFITSSYRDRFGNLWFGYNNGSVKFWNGSEFRKFDMKGSVISTINDIVDDGNGNVWMATQNNGLVCFNSKMEYSVYSKEFEGKNLYSILFNSKNELLIGTSEGLLVYNYDHKTKSFSLLKTLTEIPPVKINCIIQKKNTTGFWVGTEDTGLFLLTGVKDGKGTYSVTAIGKDFGLGEENIQDVYEDSEQNLWICTFGNGLYKLTFSPSGNNYTGFLNFNETNGLGNKFVKDVFEDREGNIWIGTYGGGLANMIDNFFTFYFHETKDYSNDVLSIYFDGENKWFGVENGLIRIDPALDKKWKFYNTANGLPADRITALCKDYRGTLWVGSFKSGIFKLDIKKDKISKFLLTNDAMANSINSIESYGEDVWVATNNGLFRINPGNNKIIHYTTNEGLPHNTVNHVYADINGQIWIATQSNDLCTFENGVLVKYRILDEALNVVSVTGDTKGNIWLATSGDGVFRFDKRIFVNLNSSTGLYSNYCYSIATDNNDNVWVGHRLGLSKIEKKSNSIRVFSKNSGIEEDCNQNAAYRDIAGNIWFGTSKGVVHYDYKKDKVNLIPPIVNITSVKFSDNEVDFTKEIKMPYNAAYRLRVDFIGLSFKNPELVTYRYKLEGYDADWSDPTTDNYKIYDRISDGEYTFILRACNSDGKWTEEPVQLKIHVNPPFWRTWWFIITSVIIIIYGIYIIIKIRERNHRRIEEYLRSTLQDRTKEVVQQKEEIELKNKDITDSINYAKRIQVAILPSAYKLRQHFPSSFIFFRPRDIVSGDFFWFNKVNTTKYIIVCSDSTGHGVPGAFMSLIGTTLIKDICLRKDVNSPSEILTTLDKEITSTLNQDDRSIETSDGMDLSACEVDMETLELRISSAMRPVYLYSNGELQYIKGQRFSIGGGRISVEKHFVNKQFQLKKGDVFYQFSDGYQDQFGGPAGRKFKHSRFKSLLESICNLPMEEQHEMLSAEFDRWKGDYKQVDDVLVIGISV